MCFPWCWFDFAIVVAWFCHGLGMVLALVFCMVLYVFAWFFFRLVLAYFCFFLGAVLGGTSVLSMGSSVFIGDVEHR